MPEPLHSTAIEIALRLAFVAAAVGGALGGWMLMRPRRAARLALGGAEGPPRALVAEIRAAGAYRMTANLGVLGVVSAHPRIGACMAAAVGLGFVGSALARAVASLSAGREDRGGRAFWIIAFEVALAVGLMAPLWAYLRLLRAHAAVGGV